MRLMEITSHYRAAAVAAAAVGIVITSVLTARPLAHSPGPPRQQAPPGPADSVRPATGLVIGQVLDGDSQQPVSDALVTLWPGSGGISLARTIVMGAPRQMARPSSGRCYRLLRVR